MSQPLQIQLEDVYKSYGDQPILQGISLSVRRS